MDEHIIWSNSNIDFDKWKKTFLKENTDENPEYKEYDDDRLLSIMYDDLAIYLDDEKQNLDIKLDTPILALATLDLWDGKKKTFKEISSGNIKDCFNAYYDYQTWFVTDDGEFICHDVHHDGTNEYVYRKYKPSVTDDDIEKLKEKLYQNTATQEDIDAVTEKLGPKIAEVYGWKLQNT